MGNTKKYGSVTCVDSSGLLYAPIASTWSTPNVMLAPVRESESSKVRNAKLGGAFLTMDNKAVFIKKVIYSDPATIVFWNDGTKTVAKCAPRDVYFPETGLAVAIIKKLVGGERTRNLFTQWLPESDNEVVDISDARKRQREE